MDELEDCSVSEVEPAQVRYPRIGPLLRIIYSATGYLMRKMVATVPDETLQRIGHEIEDPRKIDTIITKSFTENPIVLVIFVLWMLLAGALVFLAGLNFACRTLYDKKGKPVNVFSLLWAALSYLICVSTSCIGMYIFLKSVVQLRTGIELLPDQVIVATKDIRALTKAVRSNVDCLYKKKNDNFLDNCTSSYDEMVTALGDTKDYLDIALMEEAVTLANQTSGDLQEIAVTMEKLANLRHLRPRYYYGTQNAVKQAITMTNSISFLLTDVLHVSKATLDKIDKGMKILKDAKIQVQQEMEAFRKELNNALLSFENKTLKMQKEVTNVFTKQVYSRGVSQILGLTVVVPLSLVFLSTLGLAAIIISWTFHTNKPNKGRYDAKESRRGAVSIAAATVLAASGYTSMLLGAFLCTLAAVCFLSAFAAMSLCTGLFEDDELRLFYAIPNIEHTIPIGTQRIRYTLYDTFYKCKNGDTFFDALNGSEIMAKKEFSKRYSFLRNYDVAREIQNYHINPILFSNTSNPAPFLKGALLLVNNSFGDILKRHPLNKHALKLMQLLKEAHLHSDGLMETHQTLVNLLEALMSWERDRIANFLRGRQNLLREQIVTAIAGFFKAVVDFSPQCKNLLLIWFGLGKHICNWIAAPAQGLWIATMFCAIGSTAIYHSFFNTNRFLEDYAKSTRKHYTSLWKRRKQYKYVKEALGLPSAPDDSTKTKTPAMFSVAPSKPASAAKSPVAHSKVVSVAKSPMAQSKAASVAKSPTAGSIRHRENATAIIKDSRQQSPNKLKSRSSVMERIKAIFKLPLDRISYSVDRTPATTSTMSKPIRPSENITANIKENSTHETTSKERGDLKQRIMAIFRLPQIRKGPSVSTLPISRPSKSAISLENANIRWKESKEQTMPENPPDQTSAAMDQTPTTFSVPQSRTSHSIAKSPILPPMPNTSIGSLENTATPVNSNEQAIFGSSLKRKSPTGEESARVLGLSHSRTSHSVAKSLAKSPVADSKSNISIQSNENAVTITLNSKEHLISKTGSLEENPKEGLDTPMEEKDDNMRKTSEEKENTSNISTSKEKDENQEHEINTLKKRSKEKVPNDTLKSRYKDRDVEDIAEI